MLALQHDLLQHLRLGLGGQRLGLAGGGLELGVKVGEHLRVHGRDRVGAGGGRGVGNGGEGLLEGGGLHLFVRDGGAHLDGLRAAVARAANGGLGRSAAAGDYVPGEYLREGLAAVLSVRLPEAEFEGQTKGRLGSPAARPAVDGVVGDALRDLFERHPAALRAVADQAARAQKAASDGSTQRSVAW